MTTRFLSALLTAGAAAVLGGMAVPGASGGASAARPIQVADACARIAVASLGLPYTTITVAEAVAPPFTPPETFSSRGYTVDDVSFCRVAGTSRPEAGSEIRFEVWLPAADAWNGRFQGIGSGGSAGAIRYPQLAAAVRNGYAAVATDNGHTSDSGFDGSWSLGHPVRLVDFGYRAQHEATVAGKAVTGAYYGREADYAYFVGCSQGGHHALMEAQRYPDDYDGIVAGAPANYWIGLMTGELWAGLATTKDPAQDLPREKLPLLGAAVLEACDAIDGLEDGLIGDPRACDFDPGVLECAGADGADCLTAGQVAAARAIYGGPVRPSTGEQLFPGYPLGSAVVRGTRRPGRLGALLVRDRQAGRQHRRLHALQRVRGSRPRPHAVRFRHGLGSRQQPSDRHRRDDRVGHERHRSGPVGVQGQRRQADQLSRLG